MRTWCRCQSCECDRETRRETQTCRSCEHGRHYGDPPLPTGRRGVLRRAMVAEAG